MSVIKVVDKIVFRYCIFGGRTMYKNKRRRVNDAKGISQRKKLKVSNEPPLKINEVEVLEVPDTCENNKNNYRAIKLKNGLKALLISESDEEKGGITILGSDVKCALCVGVGYLSDPQDVQGLAHLVGKFFL